MTITAAIQINGLNKVYSPKKGTTIHAVNELNLSVPTGHIFGFLGPNGAGKTTTIKMICGLIRPTSGTIYLNGYNIWEKRGAAMKQIGAVLEGTRNIHWALTAWDNLIYYGHLKGLRGKYLATRAEQILKELELWDRRKDLVRIFSRGMQQKVAVGCALIADPPVILLDEPTLGLDVQAARYVKNLVVRLASEFVKTVVLTTHQLDMAQDVCNRVAIINKGKVITDKPVDELLGLFREDYYQISIKEKMPVGSTFDHMTIDEKTDCTVLTGSIKDQTALYSLIDRLKSHQLTLLSVNRIEPNLEEIFIRVLDSGLKS
jgi:ABC-2 type transport system ATP-binding protein